MLEPNNYETGYIMDSAASAYCQALNLKVTRKCSIAAESHIRSHYHISSKIQLFC